MPQLLHGHFLKGAPLNAVLGHEINPLTLTLLQKDGPHQLDFSGGLDQINDVKLIQQVLLGDSKPVDALVRSLAAAATVDPVADHCQVITIFRPLERMLTDRSSLLESLLLIHAPGFVC